VGLRLPRFPLVILSGVKPATLPAFWEAVSTGVMPADLAFCKIEEWNHVTAHLSYGQGYPDIPSWDAIPFFKGQRRLCCATCGLSILLTLRIHCGGRYQALYKVLIEDARKNVV